MQHWLSRKLFAKEEWCVVDGIEINSKDKLEAEDKLRKVYSFDIDNEWPLEIAPTYDSILFGDVLEHTKDPGRVLEQAKSILKEKGRIFVSIPNIAHMSIRIELLEGSFEYEKLGILDNTHLKYFTYNSFESLVSKHGLKIKEFDFVPSDYPKEYLVNKLKQLGLVPSQKFFKLSQEDSARAFQYKFVLEAGKLTTKKKIVIKPEIEKMNFFEDRDRDRKKLDKEHIQLINEYRSLEKKYSDLEDKSY